MPLQQGGGDPPGAGGEEEEEGPRQGLTLVRFSAQLEPRLTQENTLRVHTLNIPSHTLKTGYTIPTRTPYPIQSAQVELKSERV